MDRYPVDRKKVEALKASIESTTFWDNILARPADGGAEIAYGHHRLIALQEMYDPEHEVGLVDRDLDDEAMIKIMANENVEQWDANALIEQETVRAVRDAYTAGAIELPAPSRNRDIRYALVPTSRAGRKGEKVRFTTARSPSSWRGPARRSRPPSTPST